MKIYEKTEPYIMRWIRNSYFILNTSYFTSGQMLVELLLAIGLAAVIFPSILIGMTTFREGKVQQQQRFDATTLLQQSDEAIRNVRETGWSTFAVNGVYHPVISGSGWVLASGSATIGDFTQQVEIEDVFRENGLIASSGGVLDPSTKKVTTTISWDIPYLSSVTSTRYLTRYLDNLSFFHTTTADFSGGTLVQTKTTTVTDGETTLADNIKAKWCEPAFSSATIDLPDGPPVAVAARAAASSSTPNDVFVGTSPTATESVKLAYVNVTANTDPPTTSLRGIFTLDSTKYSDVSYVPSGLPIDNNFKTNDVKYYQAASGKIYALIATNLPGQELIAVQVNDGTANGALQDPVNNIYKFWTYFNSRIYNSSANLNTGFTNPTSNAADSGGDANGFATNASSAYSNNGQFAVDSNSGNGSGTSCTGSDKDKHRYYNYGFSLPAGATINGIEVRLDARADNQSSSPQMCVQLSWDGGTTWTTTQSTPTLTTSEATYLLGGSADTWGRTWTATELNNTNFRLRVINVSSDTTRDFSLDWAGVNVYFSGGASATNDQAPFGYGATTLTVLGDRGYVASGGYLYVFDLANIDSKSSSQELDQLGCRIQLDGYDCQPGSPAVDKKYTTGETGTTWSDNGSPAHNDCSDGGNIEFFATNDLYGVDVGGSQYIFVAIGAGTNPEFAVVNATNIPDASSSPSINSSSCGRISGGNSGWQRVGTYDFNSNSGTEEAANSVFAKSDGTRAYISSNGTSDSKQFYILNTSTKTAPAFLSGSSSTGPSSGFYQGTGANGEMYPRRSLTVLNGDRVVLVGKDGVSNSNDAQEYQVLNSSTEATPAYCGGVNFDQGFNDLTSITEADFDNYVYMVANNTANELKIIQGGPDGAYLEQGTIESSTLDVGYSTAFNRYSATITEPSNTDVQFQFAGADPSGGSCSSATFNFLGPDGTAGTYYTATTSAILLNNDGSGYENPAQCFRYKTFFSTTDYNATSILHDMTINYSP